MVVSRFRFVMLWIWNSWELLQSDHYRNEFAAICISCNEGAGIGM